MKLFDSDSKLNSFLTGVFDLILLNFCWLIGSIPIITIGASTIALYNVLFQKKSGKISNIVKPFFSAWKSSFKQGSLLWIFQIFSISLLAYFIMFSSMNRNGFEFTASFTIIISTISFVVLTLFCSTAYAHLAYFEMPLRSQFRNSLILCFIKAPLILANAIILFLPLALTIVFPVVFLKFIYIWLFFGVSLPVYFSSIIMRRVFTCISRINT